MHLPVNHEIHIRMLQVQDSNELFRLVDQNRAYLKEWLPWIDHIISPYQYQSIIPDWHKQLSENNGFQAGIFYRDQLVGMITLQQIDWMSRQASIGYYLGEAAQGKGIMTKCVVAVLNYAFYFLNLNRVEIRCGVNNLKSQAIPEKLHFKREGILRDGEWLYDHYHDLYLYSMLEREWSALHRCS